MTTPGCKHSVIKHIQQQDLNIRIWWTRSNLLSAKRWTAQLEAISYFQKHRIFKNIDQSKQSGNWSMQSDPNVQSLTGTQLSLLACCCGCFQLSSSGMFTSFEIIVLGPKVCCWSQKSGPRVPEILLSTMPQGWDYKCILQCLSLFTMWVLQTK